MRLPIGVGEGLGGVEDADAASLVAVAAGVAAVGGVAWCDGGGDLGDGLMQG